ncbi:MAG: hypothetical protein CL793_06580 [Chloroflexi bacterium]|nr:hypothetical protein [Chloroflexota bacterium]|tara:strand:- start:1915 stop:2415 length:501 start_codon:yes stop_codon:yes gene_type:complete
MKSSFYTTLSAKLTSITLALLLLPSCQAPAPIIEAQDLAGQLDQMFRGGVQMRLDQYSRELASSWERELNHVIRAELSKASEGGMIPEETVLTLLQQQSEARKHNQERIALERKADQEAAKATSEIDKLRASIRRWMAAGMTTEERDRVYQIAGESARRMISNDNN